MGAAAAHPQAALLEEGRLEWDRELWDGGERKGRIPGRREARLASFPRPWPWPPYRLAVFACFELSRPPEVVAKIWQASSCLVCLRWQCSHLRLPLSNSTRGRENRGIPSHCNGHIMCLAVHRVCECVSGRISRSAERTRSGPNHEGERAGTAGCVSMPGRACTHCT